MDEYKKNKKEDDLPFSKRLNIRNVRSENRISINLYPVTAVYKNEEKKKPIEIDVYSCSIDFPDTKLPRHKSRIKYRVNTIYSREQRASLN